MQSLPSVANLINSMSRKVKDTDTVLDLNIEFMVFTLDMQLGLLLL